MKLLKKSLMARHIPDLESASRTPRAAMQWKRNSGLGCVTALVMVLLTADLSAAPAARFTRISVEQGLSQSTVQAILQDHVGFLWFGTEEGLNRYDGYTFVVFRHDPNDPLSLPDNMVSALYEDRQGRLWVGTQGGLSLFDRRTETFTSVPSVRERVSSIVEDPDGKLWVGSQGGGLFEQNPATGLFARHQPYPHDPVSLVSWNVSTVLRDRSGRLWIGTRGGGVDLLEEGSRRFIHHRHDPRNPRSLAHNEVWGLAEDEAGNLWVATYGGLSVLDHKTGAFRHYGYRTSGPESLPTYLLTCVFVDRSGKIWIGTDGAGVLQYDAASDRFTVFLNDPNDPSSLSHNVVRTIYEDAQGQLWVGTYQGGANLLKRPRRAFGYYTPNPKDPSSLGGTPVGSFLEDGEGRIWVGTGGWLNRFERETGTFVRHRLPSFVPGLVTGALSLHQDRRGRIWIGTYRAGLARFDPLRGTFMRYSHRPGDSKSLGNDEVWAIAEDDEGKLWLGTNGSLDRFDPDLGAVTAHYGAHYESPSPEKLSHAGVRALLFDRKGDLWIGTLGGLYLMRRGGESFIRYRRDDRTPGSLSHDSVVALCEDHQGRLWVGTFGGGLNLLDPEAGTFTSYKEFPSNAICGIQEDSSGRLWLSTNHGLSRFDPANESIENFDLTNGLQSLQFHLGASLRTRGGRMLFGSVDGFYDFDPEAIKPDTYAPPVVLTSLRIFNETVKLPAALSILDEITLSHGDKIFSLEFAALDYTLPRRNRYEYILEGFSNQWMQLGNKREVTFTNLDPGSYVFRVKATNSDGVWNEASAVALRVIVRPPFWMTWWFRGLCLTMFVLVLLSAHRIRVRHLTADITERKRAEMALRWAEEKYRSIFENAMEGIFQSTPDGRFLSVNPAMAQMYGYASPEEMIRSVTDIASQLYVNPEQRSVLWRCLESEGVVHGFETQDRRKDGSLFWSSVTMRAVRDAQGNVLYYDGILQDITERKRAEEALHESEERFRLVALATRDAIYDWDIRTGTVWRNEAYQTLYSPNEPIGTDETWWEQQIHPEDRGRIVESIRNAFRTQSRFWLDEYSFRRYDGSYATVFDRGYVLYDQAGKPIRMIGAITDITERKRAESLLRESEERYRALYDENPSMFFTVDSEGTVLSVNQFGAGQLGYTPEELIGQPVIGVFYEEDRRSVVDQLKASLSNPNQIAHWEFRKVRKDGSILSVKEAARAIKDSDGKMVVLIVCEDITERKRAEERQARLQAALQDAATEWQLTFDAIESILLIVDLDGCVIRLNQTAQELSAKEIIGLPVEAVDSGEPWQKAAELVRLIRDSGTTVSTQVEDKVSGKTWEIAGSLYRGVGSDERIIVVARDVTQTVKLQQSLRRSETMSAMGALVAGVAHEVRNPLFGISATLDAFEEFSGDQEEYKENVALLRRGLDRLSSLMQDLLDYGRPLALELSPGSVEQVISQAVRSCGPLAERLGVRVVNNVSNGLAPVRMDRGRLAQVFQNLIENAMQHSPRGEMVRVETGQVYRDDWAWIECRVMDSGPGIDVEDLQRIFEPFYSRRRGGTGLGLSIVQRIVEEHQGKISAGNRAEGGAIMKVELPCEEVGLVEPTGKR